MMGIRRSPLNRFWIAIMPIGIPALVITIQLSVWAVLVHYGYGEVSWKRSKDSVTLDVARLLKDQPDLLERYPLIRAGSRRFVVSA